MSNKRGSRLHRIRNQDHLSFDLNSTGVMLSARDPNSNNAPQPPQVSLVGRPPKNQTQSGKRFAAELLK